MGRILGILTLGLCLLATESQAAFWHKPPGPPATGYGSGEHYICATYTEYRFGSAALGDQTWYYVPDQLKYGDHAPVVIFLHGFAALFPQFYQAHLDHLIAQGNIVIFPQFQKATLAGFFGEAGLGQAADQNLWAERAVVSVNEALALLGNLADPRERYLYGHSLGGLIALAWQASDGVPVEAVVLSHPQVNAQEGIPPFVRSFLNIIEIPWQDYAGDITAPVIILNGTEDTIATVAQSEDILARVSGAESRVLYVAQRDCFGYPCLSPNHGAPLDAIAGLPPHVKIAGISAERDALDWRYYFAGLDAVMDGYRTGLPFDLGAWSNGRTVKPVQEFFAP